MNIYEKLQIARNRLIESGIEKTGRNAYAKYSYYELEDFLPTINRIFQDIKLCGITNFVGGTGTLTIVNAENPEEKIVFESLQGTAALKGCHSIQNQGAVMTYQRRYLYIVALEITEAEMIDKETGKDSGKDSPKTQQKESEGPESIHDFKKGIVSALAVFTKYDILGFGDSNVLEKSVMDNLNVEDVSLCNNMATLTKYYDYLSAEYKNYKKTQKTKK